MYAVIYTGGQQHKVQSGEELKIAKLDLDEGEKVEFDKVLMVADGEDIKIGTPYLDGVKVTAEIIAQGRDKKIKIIKFKRRKHHMKHMGHRQYFTQVKIVDIQS